jgi:hypothetical protein
LRAVSFGCQIVDVFLPKEGLIHVRSHDSGQP